MEDSDSNHYKFYFFSLVIFFVGITLWKVYFFIITHYEAIIYWGKMLSGIIALIALTVGLIMEIIRLKKDRRYRDSPEGKIAIKMAEIEEKIRIFNRQKINLVGSIEFLQREREELNKRKSNMKSQLEEEITVRLFLLDLIETIIHFYETRHIELWNLYQDFLLSNQLSGLAPEIQNVVNRIVDSIAWNQDVKNITSLDNKSFVNLLEERSFETHNFLREELDYLKNQSLILSDINESTGNHVFSESNQVIKTIEIQTKQLETILKL